MFYYILTSLINAFTSTTLGLLVYFKNRKSALNKTFALLCLSIAGYASLYFFWLVFGTTKSIALFFGRALNTVAIFIPITYFHFTTVFLNIYQKKKKLVILGYLLSFILFISGFTPLFIKDVEPELSFSWYPKPGITFYLFTLLFFNLVIYSWYLMFRAIKKVTGTMNIQIKYVLIGTFIGFIGGSTNFFPVYDIPIPPLGNGLVAIYVASIAFAILKYHLFEIRAILTELLVGIMGIVLLVLPFVIETTFSMRILMIGVFILFCFIGYLLIKYTRRELKTKEILEEKVEERTKEVQTAYEDIKKRKEDLERFYSLTVGRELKMIELKKKIKELEENK